MVSMVPGYLSSAPLYRLIPWYLGVVPGYLGSVPGYLVGVPRLYLVGVPRLHLGWLWWLR